MSLFSQSRILHRELRRIYEYDLFGIESPSLGLVPMLNRSGFGGQADQQLDQRRVAMLFLTETFHNQLFDAIQRNPLSALLSIAWTLSSTAPIQHNMTDERYLATWSPLLCAVNAVRLAHERHGAAGDTQLSTTSIPIDASASQTRSSSSSATAAAAAVVTAAEAATVVAPFDLQDLRLMDQSFIAALKDHAAMNMQELEQRQLAVINNPAFEQLLRDTPFGTYQITSVDEQTPDGVAANGTWTLNGYRYVYVSEPINLMDRMRYAYTYTRCEKSELLRRQLEIHLRERYHVYHDLYGLNVCPWLIALHERDSATGAYASLWQLQKASLVWLFMHTLAALVTLLDHDELIADFLTLVCSLDIFIECGLCHDHWRTLQLPRWNLVRKKFLLDSSLSSTAHSNASVSVTTGTKSRNVDWLLLKTHNDIQTSTNPNVRLTKAALSAVREDYLNVAKCIITATSIRSIPTSFLATLNKRQLAVKPYLPDQFSSTVSRREANRKDLCEEPNELWAVDLQRKAPVAENLSDDRKIVKRALLQLEWARKNYE